MTEAAFTISGDEPATDICSQDVFTLDGEGLAMTGNGYARMYSALDGIRVISAILIQLELDKDCPGGNKANTNTVTGLLNALGTCNEFAQDLLHGRGHHSRVIHSDDAKYQDLKRLVSDMPAT